MSEQRQALMSELATQIAAKCKGAREIVAIDGVDGAGKTMFANELAPSIARLGLHVVRAGVDGFHNPRAVRYARGKADATGFFIDSYNYDALRTHLMAPFRGGAGVIETARFEHTTDRVVTTSQTAIPPQCLLLFDGIFLHRDELRDLWDFSIFLEVPFGDSYARMAIRDGGSPDPDDAGNRRYRLGQEHYIANFQPARRASLVIDNSDLQRPRILPHGR